MYEEPITVHNSDRRVSNSRDLLRQIIESKETEEQTNDAEEEEEEEEEVAPHPPLSNKAEEAYNRTELSAPRVATVNGIQMGYHSCQQKEVNRQLRTELIDIEDSLSTVYEQLVSYVDTKPKSIQQKIVTSNSALLEFETGTKCTEVVTYSIRKLLSFFGLKTTSETFNKLLSTSLPDISFLRPCLKELSKQQQRENKIPRRKWEQRREQLGTLVPLCVMISSSFSVEELPRIIIEAYEYLHTDVLSFIKSELQATDSEIRDLRKEVQTAELFRNRSQKEGQLGVSGEQHFLKVKKLKQLCDIYNSRVRTISSGQSDTGSFVDSVCKFLNEAKEKSTSFLKDKQMLATSVEEDISTLHDKMQIENESHHSKLSDFENESENSFLKIQNIAEEQNKLWEDIEKLVSRIKQLGQDRSHLISNHIIRKQEQERRKEDHRILVQRHREHLQGMAHLKEFSTQALHLGQEVCEYVTKMEQLLSEKKTEEAVKDLTIQEERDYLRVYREFVLCSGELQTRTQQRVSNTERLNRIHDVQVALAAESYDAEVGTYKMMQKTISSDLSNSNDLLSSIDDLMQSAASDFVKTEESLNQSNEHFIPPTVELKGLQAKIKEISLLKTQQFIEIEQNEAESEQTTIRRLNNLMQQQTQELKVKNPQSIVSHDAL